VATPEDDYVIINSDLSGEMRRDGITVQVEIYRGEEDDTWVLEVVDSENASIVWDERFETERAAMDELLATIRTHGMKQFNPHTRKRTMQ
jgi:hypothetical protein